MTAVVCQATQQGSNSPEAQIRGCGLVQALGYFDGRVLPLRLSSWVEVLMLSVFPIVGRFNDGSLGSAASSGYFFHKRVSPLAKRKCFCLVFFSSKAVSPTQGWGQMQFLGNFVFCPLWAVSTTEAGGRLQVLGIFHRRVSPLSISGSASVSVSLFKCRFNHSSLSLGPGTSFG